MTLCAFGVWSSPDHGYSCPARQGLSFWMSDDIDVSITRRSRSPGAWRGRLVTMSFLREFLKNVAGKTRDVDSLTTTEEKPRQPSGIFLVADKDLSIPVGGKYQFNAMLEFPDGDRRDLAKNVAWRSSAPEMLAIDEHGLASA